MTHEEEIDGVVWSVRSGEGATAHVERLAITTEVAGCHVLVAYRDYGKRAPCWDVRVSGDGWTATRTVDTDEGEEGDAVCLGLWMARAIERLP